MKSKQNRIVAAERTRNIKYAIRDIVVLAEEIRRQGREMIYLNIGDPIKSDFETPSHIIDAIHRGMIEGDTGYGPSEGIGEAVEAVRREAEQKGISNINSICITTGASEGIELALTALVNPGENVLLPSPGYPLYSAVMSKIHAEVNSYFLDEDNGWQPDVADIEAKVNDKTRAIVVINPNNPTGSIASAETLGQIVDVARKHNLVILADEIYDKILFEGETHTSLASVAGDHPCVTFNGISKSYLGPGLRIGWAIISGDPVQTEDFQDAFMKMARARLCANTPMQWAVKPALEGDQSHLVEMMRRLEIRCDLAVSRLNKIDGFSCVRPKGAFYIFPSIVYHSTDWDFVTDLLKETGVVTVPGSGFGQVPGTKHIRIVLLPTEDEISRAMDLIEEFVRKRRG